MSALSFEYIAVGRDGRPQRGVVSAANRQEAYRRLASDGLVPTKIRKPKAKLSFAGMFGKRIRPQEIAHFTYQLSVLLEARIPVVSAFSSIADQTSHPGIADIARDLAREVQSGRSITDALDRHRAVFGSVYLETVRPPSCLAT
ncbi:MAG: type II secretion system F family protein [Phycisphaerales bacterium]